MIDENSPDEDERQAMQALQAPRKVLKKTVVSASSKIKLNSYLILLGLFKSDPPPIDENSADEMQAIRAPRQVLKKTVVSANGEIKLIYNIIYYE